MTNVLARTRRQAVLLVEDDHADAMLIEEALIEHGIARDVSRAVDGVDGWSYLRDENQPLPDLIVLDLNMPRMNGRELLALIKADEELRSIPVVVLTTSSAPDDVDGAYDKHANAYVTKPVGLDAFTYAVQSIEQFFLDTAQLPER